MVQGNKNNINNNSLFSTLVKVSLSLSLVTVAFAENPILRREAQEQFKRTRVTADVSLKAWSDKTKGEVAEIVKKLKAANLDPAVAASSQTALDLLKNDEFKAQVIAKLSALDKKDWQEAFKDVQALLQQKNLRLEDLAANPQIVLTYIQQISAKEKAFWEQRQKVLSPEAAPITEAMPASNIPSGSLAEALKLVKALSLYVKVEGIEPNSNNLLLRFFVAP